MRPTRPDASNVPYQAGGSAPGKPRPARPNRPQRPQKPGAAELPVQVNTHNPMINPHAQPAGFTPVQDNQPRQQQPSAFGPGANSPPPVSSAKVDPEVGVNKQPSLNARENASSSSGGKKKLIMVAVGVVVVVIAAVGAAVAVGGNSTTLVSPESFACGSLQGDEDVRQAIAAKFASDLAAGTLSTDDAVFKLPATDCLPRHAFDALSTPSLHFWYETLRTVDLSNIGLKTVDVDAFYTRPAYGLNVTAASNFDFNDNPLEIFDTSALDMVGNIVRLNFSNTQLTNITNSRGVPIDSPQSLLMHDILSLEIFPEAMYAFGTIQNLDLHGCTNINIPDGYFEDFDGTIIRLNMAETRIAQDETEEGFKERTGFDEELIGFLN